MLQTVEATDHADAVLRQRRDALDALAYHNQIKVLRAFQEAGVGDGHFAGTTGYGFHDTGRETLDAALAAIFGAEAGLLRWQFVSGTHAIACALLGNLRPGDRMLCVTGPPYDTLKPVLWDEPGSLESWGIACEQIPLHAAGGIDLETACNRITPSVRAIFIQRSCGYDWRRSLSCEDIGRAVQAFKSVQADLFVLVDNCYGELVEATEPTQHGADLTAGSLIKNLGGGLCPTGGYLAGRRDLIRGAARAVTAPGIDGEEGATLGLNRTLFQGLFYAPMVVNQALCGAVWSAALMSRLGFTVQPGPDDPRTDIIQGIRFGTPERLLAFCQGIQAAGPVDSRATLQPVMNPGYRDPIVMAGGTFIQGSSIELSADGPIREPYAAYLQGGISLAHVKYGVKQALERLR